MQSVFPDLLTKKLQNMVYIIAVILTVNALFIGDIKKDKEDTRTRIEKKHDRRREKAIANVKKWKQNTHGTSVMTTQIAPNK